MMPKIENTPTDRNREKERVSVDTKKRELVRQSDLRARNPFNYRICISWFGGVQIYPKS